MSSPSQAVHVLNLALDLLRQEPISAINPPTTKMEKLCARWYNQKRRATLRKHTWNFATKRESFPVLAEAPAFGYTIQMALPNDYIRILGVGETEIDDVPHEIENRRLLLDYDATEVPLRYVYNHENIATWDPLAIDILAVELAIVIAPQVKGSFNESTKLIEYLKDLTDEAYSVDGQERPPTTIVKSRALNARRGYRRSLRADRVIFED